MTTIIRDPALTLTFDEERAVRFIAERLKERYEDEATRLKRYGFHQIAREADQEAVHIKELLKGDFFSDLAEELAKAREGVTPVMS